jgi:hypothetical protein
MTQKPDSTKIDAALRRAAYKALYGNREERSGRFKPSERERSSSHIDAGNERFKDNERSQKDQWRKR